MEFEFIRAYDPALDRDAMKAEGVWESFLESRDPKLAIIEQESADPPVIFKCRTLTRSERRQLDGLLDERKRETAFKLGVVSVVNAVYPDKSRRTWSRRDTAKPLRDADLDLFAEADIQHVGQGVISYSFCPPDSSLYVPLLATCLDALIAAGLESQRRRAERVRKQAADQSDAGKSTLKEQLDTTPTP